MYSTTQCSYLHNRGSGWSCFLFNDLFTGAGFRVIGMGVGYCVGGETSDDTTSGGHSSWPPETFKC